MRNFISPIIEDRIPDFLKREYKKFTLFINHFYQFLEEQGNPLEILENFYERCEANNQIEGYIDKLLNEIGFNINRNLFIYKKELLLHLREFYLSRGSEESFRFLFKILFNADVSIDYPRKKLLIPSQATYSGRYFVFTTSFNKNTDKFNKIIQLSKEYDIKLQGISSKVECFVEDISQIYNKDDVYLKIQIDSALKNFQRGEGVNIISASTGIHIIENIKDVIDLEIQNPGSGYTIGDKINISNTNLVGLIKVKTLKEGIIDDVIISNGGQGYAVDDQILTDIRSKGHSFSAVVSKVDNSENYLSIPNHSSLQLESGDFAIEMWIYRFYTNNESIICSTKDPTLSKGWTLKIDNRQKLSFEIYGTTNYKVTSVSPCQSNAWTHIAVSRAGNILRTFINGIKMSQNTVGDGVISAMPLKIGIGTTGNNPFIGYISELRITKDVSRYETNFYVPVTKLDSTDPLFNNVSLLIHFEGPLNSAQLIDSSLSAKTITTNGAIYISNKVIKIGTTSGYFSGLGRINKIAIYNRGYGYDSLPTFTINSEFGNGAVLIPSSSSIGQIESLEFLDPYIDSYDTPLVSVTSKNGSGAVLNPVSKTVFKETPSWKSFEGILGINSTLLDSYYFQYFSYEVYSPISRKEYDNIVDDWLHPFGFVRFSILDITYSSVINSPDGGFLDTFILTIIKVINGRDDVFMINPIYRLHWLKELSDYNFTNWVGGFDWIKEEWTTDNSYYMAQALDTYSINKIYVIKDARVIFNPQSGLNWFKEAEDNYSYPIGVWDDFTTGDPPKSPSEITTDINLLSRHRINNDTLIMNKALDAEIIFNSV